MRTQPGAIYRPDIDGLRGIAVAGVIGFHAFPAWLPGGFVGVDVFFVVSGFLITGIIRSEAARQQFTLAGFYARRIRRIFPALILVLLTSFLFGWSFLFRTEFRELGKHIAGGAGFLSNIVLWREAGYFDKAADLKPLLHLWSLGIEEQFYLAWPLLFVLLIRHQALRAVTIAICALSFALNVGFVSQSPTATFYLPFTRLWELMLGAGLACAGPVDSRRLERLALRLPASLRHVFPALIALAGLLGILASMIMFHERLSFPGWVATIPTVGTALVIAAGPGNAASRLILSQKTLVYVGLISYPLYLWHWPLLSFAGIVRPASHSTEQSAFLMVAALLLAAMTYHFVELPVRRASGSARLRSPVISSLAMLGLALIALGLAAFGGLVQPRLSAITAIEDAVHDWHYPGDSAAQSEGRPETVLVFGDSYVQQYYPRVRWLALRYPERIKTVRFKTEGGCAPIPHLARLTQPRCARYAAEGFRMAAAAEVGTVIIGGSWLGMTMRGDYYDGRDPAKRMVDFGRSDVFDDLTGAIKQLVRSGKTVVIVLNPPGGPQADPLRFDINRWTGELPRVQHRLPMDAHRARTGAINARLRAVAAASGAKVVDPAQWLCTGAHCKLSTPDGLPYFKDGTHLRASFVRCCVEGFDEYLLAPE